MTDASQGEGWWLASDGKWYPPSSAPGVSAPPPPDSAGEAVNKVPGILLLVAGGLAVLGSFLPWVTVTAPFVGTITRSGIDGGDGIFSVAIGVGLGVLGFVHLDRRPTRGVLIAGVLLCLALGGLTAWEFWDIGDRTATAEAQSDLIVTSYGTGLYLLGAAVVVGIAGLVKTNEQVTARSPSPEARWPSPDATRSEQGEN